MSKIKKIILKKISPLVGNLLDSLFLTNFSRRGLDHYHGYHQNDYKFNKSSICLIHVPRSGGGTLRKYLKKEKNFLVLNDGSQHYPVSLLCDPQIYRYVTILRNPIYRTISHFYMLTEMKTKVASFGFSNWLINDKLSKNLYCQYLSGHVYENVDERIYNIALSNLKNFYYVIDFNNIEVDLKNLLNKLNLKIDEEVKNYSYKILTNYPKHNEKFEILSKKYNFWDIKLYNEFLELKKNRKINF
tara:strand:- start:133 stop:864 length:732 start_codon:yes stop_codon:yes gene_type:complete